MRRSTDFLAQDSLREQADAYRDCGERLQDEGVDLAGYTLPQRVDDLEAARGRSATTRWTSSARAPALARR